MKKLEIIVTPDYILAVSDEEIKENDYYVTDFKVVRRCDKDSIGLANYAYDKIIAYKPKGNAPELDLPLLPEMVLEDDVEKLADEFVLNTQIHRDIERDGWLSTGFVYGYKAATKVYSEEDLRKAFEAGNKRGWSGYPDTDNWTQPKFEEFIQSLKQPKPKWFVAEIDYYYHSSKDFYSDAEFVKCTKEQYESIKSEIPTCPLKTELKTTAINGKTYLVGNYKYE